MKRPLVSLALVALALAAYAATSLSTASAKTVHAAAVTCPSNPVTFAVEGPTPPAKDPWGNTRIGASATTKISRKDYGLTWNAALETGGILGGD